MWMTLIKLIVPFITGTTSAILTDWFKSRKEYKLRKLDSDTQIALANIEVKNSTEVRESEMQKMFSEQTMQIQKLISKKSGNRFVDAANALVRTITTYWYIIIVYPVTCVYFRNDPIIRDSIIATTDVIISFWFTNRSLNK